MKFIILAFLLASTNPRGMHVNPSSFTQVFSEGVPYTKEGFLELTRTWGYSIEQSELESVSQKLHRFTDNTVEAVSIRDFEENLRILKSGFRSLVVAFLSNNHLPVLFYTENMAEEVSNAIGRFNFVPMHYKSTLQAAGIKLVSQVNTSEEMQQISPKDIINLSRNKKVPRLGLEELTRKYLKKFEEDYYNFGGDFNIVVERKRYPSKGKGTLLEMSDIHFNISNESFPFEISFTVANDHDFSYSNFTKGANVFRGEAILIPEFLNSNHLSYNFIFIDEMDPENPYFIHFEKTTMRLVSIFYYNETSKIVELIGFE